MNLVVQQNRADILPSSLRENPSLDEGAVRLAIQVSAETGQPFRQVLDRMGLVSQKDWAHAIAQDLKLPFLGSDDFPALLPSDKRLSIDYLRQNSVVLLAADGPVPKVAMADPQDLSALQALKMVLGRNFDILVATDHDIESALGRLAEYTEEKNTPTSAADAKVLASDADRLMELANNAPTVRYLEWLFSSAVEQRATDIHIEIIGDRPRTRLRVDGLLIEANPVESALYEGVVSRIKILAGMDISERRLPQDGRIRKKSAGQNIDVRVASTPTIHGEALVLRLLSDFSGLKGLTALDMPMHIRTQMDHALRHPNGLILMTGPTGSGKTTTLHAALSQLNKIDRKIITIENPVEIQSPGVIQIEVNPDLGWTFGEALRTILRHDPDILMVGEIRDAETAELAVRAAMTGHLVLSTLHTNTAAEAIMRLKDMGVPGYLLQSVLRLVGAQRLVRTLCDGCAAPVAPQRIKKVVELFSRLDPSLGPAGDWTPREAKGCSMCNGTGFAGRTAVFETIDMTVASEGTDQSDGNRRTLGLEAIGLFAHGRTSLSELVRVFGAGKFWK
ncbi:MAG: GspE/PulE family protein [Pseudomonadota bacterium]